VADRQAIRLRVFGTVQGVGFRWFVVRAAESAGVDGWVRNLDDGSVELLAEGDRESLEDLARIVASGPPGARVSSVDRRSAEAEGIGRGFRILRDSAP